MKRELWLRIGLVVGSMVLALGALELALRLGTRPSSQSYGHLFGELPPVDLVVEDAFVGVDRDRNYKGLIVDGEKVTYGDLWGIMREDELLGYAPAESAISTHGWWQSNNIGARSSRDTERERIPGTRRLLVFGESFTSGSRVPQKKSWPWFLQREDPRLDVVNLAVDGYSMGQSFLRYRQLRDRVEHDIVVLGFVPSEDLIREINTLRSLMRWKAAMVLPRFVTRKDGLELIRGPYRSMEEFRRDNLPDPSAKLLEHLRAYDSLYFPDKYEVDGPADALLIYKVCKRLRYTLQERRLQEGLMRPDSEARQVAQATLDAMAREVTSRGQRFVLVFIPTSRDVARSADDAEYSDWWDGLVADCPADTVCIDLRGTFEGTGRIDRGYDGTHFGPKTNKALAQRVYRRLAQVFP